MKAQVQLSTLILLVSFACLVAAGEREKSKKAPVGKRSSSAPPEVMIRAAAKDFAAAFNRGSAKDVAAHWTSDGEYINETGQRFAGRESIQAEYEAFFKQFPGITMRITVDSVRLDRSRYRDRRRSGRAWLTSGRSARDQ